MGDLAIVIALIGISAMLVSDQDDRSFAILFNAVACAIAFMMAVVAVVAGK